MARKPSSDDITNFFEYGLDITNRTIYVGETNYDSDGNGVGVDSLMASRFIKALHILDKQAPAGDKPITVITNNPGGSWYDGMSMFGAIKACTNHVTFKLYGYAMSMGSIIPQAADHVIINKYCRFMIHYGYDGSPYDHGKTVSKNADEGKKVRHAMENIYLTKLMKKDAEMIETGDQEYIERTLAEIINKQHSLDYPPHKLIKYKFSKNIETRTEEIRKVLKELLNFDTYLSAEETVALGFADEVEA